MLPYVKSLRRAVAVPRTAALLVAAPLLVACGSSSASGPGDVPSGVTKEPPPPAYTPGGDHLTRVQACAESITIAQDYLMTDDQNAVAYDELAARTDDPAVARALQHVGSLYAQHDPNVDASSLVAACP